MKHGLVYLWTGIGAGKTSSALGVALRAVGQARKVIVIQFLKGRKDIGEYKIAKKLGQNYEIYQFGRKEFVDPKNLKPIDYELAKKGLEFAYKSLNKKPFLLILDEINLAVHGGLLKAKDIIDFLNIVPSSTTVYLTGRFAPKELINRADFVNEIQLIKQPKKFPPAKRGIEW